MKLNQNLELCSFTHTLISKKQFRTKLSLWVACTTILALKNPQFSEKRHLHFGFSGTFASNLRMFGSSLIFFFFQDSKGALCIGPNIIFNKSHRQSHIPLLALAVPKV